MTTPTSTGLYHTYAFAVQRLTRRRGLLRPLGSIEIILPGRASVSRQQQAARIIRRSRHDYPLARLWPLHRATKARRLTHEQAARYEHTCRPLPF